LIAPRVGHARRPAVRATRSDLGNLQRHEGGRDMYIDGFVMPLQDGKLGDYTTMAQMFAGKAKALGAIGSLEALGDGLEHGHTTDFFRAVQARDDENVVLSFVLWPDKATRDAAWEKLMADPDMQPGAQPMPFDGKRMFWGGFKPFVDTLGLG
jgi:uncharacterized protein YbaA (DUF1428 family)